MYNWSAATNSLSYQDFSKSTTGFITPNVGDADRFTGYNKRQGICPNGWHLPSFSETVDLLNEMYNNTSTYSSSADKSTGELLGDGTNGKIIILVLHSKLFLIKILSFQYH